MTPAQNYGDLILGWHVFTALPVMIVVAFVAGRLPGVNRSWAFGGGVGSDRQGCPCQVNVPPRPGIGSPRARLRDAARLSGLRLDRRSSRWTAGRGRVKRKPFERREVTTVDSASTNEDAGARRPAGRTDSPLCPPPPVGRGHWRRGSSPCRSRLLRLGEAGNRLRIALGHQMVDERGDGPFLRRRQICTSEPSRQMVLGNAPTRNVVASQLQKPSVLDS